MPFVYQRSNAPDKEFLEELQMCSKTAESKSEHLCSVSRPTNSGYEPILIDKFILVISAGLHSTMTFLWALHILSMMNVHSIL